MVGTFGRPPAPTPPDVDVPRTDEPQHFDEVVDWFGAGRLTTEHAFALLRTVPGSASRTSAERHGGPAKTSGSRGGDDADEERERRRRLDAVIGELNSLIGLSSVKQLVLELRAFLEIQRRRADCGLLAENTALHMIFKGNPGTGKTTVARVLGRMLREMDALPKGHLIECERADLVGEYIGHTAQRTRERIRKAMGGVLFVDEAYALARGGEKDFGKEAIDTLVKSMEDFKDEFVVILAGYREEMDMFLASNPGLRSRFPVHIDFPDYTHGELMAIAELMCAQRQYRLSPGARRRLAANLERVPRTPYDGNARYVRNVLERAMRRQALRLSRRRKLSRDELMTLEAADVWEAVSGADPGGNPHALGGKAGVGTPPAGKTLADLARAFGFDPEAGLSAG